MRLSDSVETWCTGIFLTVLDSTEPIVTFKQPRDILFRVYTRKPSESLKGGI